MGLSRVTVTADQFKEKSSYVIDNQTRGVAAFDRGRRIAAAGAEDGQGALSAPI
jgi:hypothetical protein